ncbi:MAG TPA: hypothetical protein DHW67_02370 [Agrobacterium sp.]|nr:hypothetical protein [Agrobacterium sp.]
MPPLHLREGGIFLFVIEFIEKKSNFQQPARLLHVEIGKSLALFLFFPTGHQMPANFKSLDFWALKGLKRPIRSFLKSC